MTRPLRIGIDARLLAYRSGGIAEYTRSLIGALAALDSQNHYLILHARRAGSDTLAPGSNFQRITCWTPCHHRIERSAFGVEVARLNLDVLHSPDFIPPRLMPIGGPRRRVITIHDLYFLNYPQYQTADSQRYYGSQIQAAVHEADHILAVSEATRAEICDRLHVSPAKITVQPEGVDSAFQPLPPAQIALERARLGLPDTYLLFVGTIEPRKNIAGLLRACAILRTILPDAPPLVIVGRRGWLAEDVQSQARDLGLTSDQVTWRQDIADSDRSAVYNGASAVVLPSYYEGFGLPALEAFACGVPVIASARGGLVELAGGVGLLVDPDQPESIADGLRLALIDTAWRTESIAAGLERAKGYSWARAAAIALKVYEET